MGYTRDIIKGLSLYGFLRFATKAIGFLEVIILARILVPAQFGAYGIALLALGLLEVITETGVNVVLIQQNTVDEYINAAWTISILRGMAITILLYISAPFIATFFHSSQALILLKYISLAPFLRGFINPSIVKLHKELLFGKDVKYQFTILIIDTVTSITITYLTRNPIGIVIGLLVGVAVELLLSFIIVSPRPKPDFNKEYLGKIYHGGKWVTGSGIFEYLFENADNIVVGRLLGTTALGIYQIAYALSVIPLNEVGKVFVYVMTPVLVKISHDSKRLKDVFLRSLLFTILLLIPIVLVLIFFPDIFVWILGQKWSQLIYILPVLALVGFFRSVSGVSSALFMGLKKQKYTTIIALITTSGLVLFIIPFVNNYGIVGAGYAGLLSTIIGIPFSIIFILKILRNA